MIKLKDLKTIEGTMFFVNKCWARMDEAYRIFPRYEQFILYQVHVTVFFPDGKTKEIDCWISTNKHNTIEDVKCSTKKVTAKYIKDKGK